MWTAPGVIFVWIRKAVRATSDVLQYPAGVRLEGRWNEELVGTGRVWAFRDPLEADRDALGLEPTLGDLGLDPGLRHEH